MAINFSDPGQTTNAGKPIPINTQEKFDKGKAILQAMYAYYGVPWTADSEAAYEKRVRNGQTMKEIIENTHDEYLSRAAE